MDHRIPDNETDKLALDAASEPYGVEADALAGARVLDVRRAAAFGKADAMIPGAQWRDPERLPAWSAELPKGEAVIVYCVYGHEVGRSTAMCLRAAGVDARFLRGGFEAWKTAGRPLAPK